MSRRSRNTLVLALVALGLAAGCAEEREPINRVQPNALPKKFFVGEKLSDTSDDPEFWTQATLTDVGYGAAQDGLFTSTYAQPLARVKFTIQEKYLIARLTYERIADSDHKGMGPQSSDGIVVAVFPIESHFDIQREYNAVTGEEYNVIGENTSDRPWNEREYMRVDWSKNLNTDSYDFDTLSQLGVYGGVTYEPLAYYINDPTDEDAPHFNVDQGYFDVTNKAFAVPDMIDLSMFGWGIDAFPSCYLEPDFLNGSAPSGNCNPVELTVRQSFRRVVDNDYEPFDWDGYRMKAYGAFYTDRRGYARNYGMVDDRWYRFVNRYNIWERSHYYADPEAMTGSIPCFTPVTTPAGVDPNRDDNGNGTSDECEGVTLKLNGIGGSRCDTFTQKCTLPLRARTPVTQVWYYTTGSDPTYFDGSDWAAHEWDVALRSAVMTGRYAECVRTGGDRATCERDWPIYRGQQDENEDAVRLATEIDACRRGVAYVGQDCNAVAQTVANERGYSQGVIETAKFQEMIVLCHSPVQANDPAVCGSQSERLPADMTAANCYQAKKDHDAATLAKCQLALNARIGDLRFNQINVIETPQTPSPWGIMVDSVDPYNGQKVSTSINAWSYVTDFWSQIVVDTSRYIKGELSDSDVTDGVYIKNWSQAAQSASGGGAAPLLTARDVDSRISAFVGRDVSSLSPQVGATLRSLPGFKAMREEANYLAKDGIKFEANTAGFAAAVSNARMHRAQGTEVEAQLMTPMMRQYAGVSKLGSADVATMFASPLRAANPSVMREMRRLRELALAERGACVLQESPVPLGVANLADALQKKFGNFNKDDSKAVQQARAEKMRQYLAQRVHYSVIIHEMGHSVALRHNFVSSADAFNYRPQYWQLRTNDGTVKNVCTDLQTAAGAENCIGPRYFDQMTQAEKENLIWMFMQSSTMDYAGETTQDLLGIGAWDFASARMVYSDVVAVFDDDGFNTASDRAIGLYDKMDNFGGIIGLQFKVRDPACTASDPKCYEKERSLHYSELDKYYELIKDCHAITKPEVFKPADWDDATRGPWDPFLDGLMVQQNGSYTRCKQQPVDYISWNGLRFPTKTEAGQYYYGGPAVDKSSRIRVPYGFATDSWADLGNLSVYRHDNGADAYELFDFFISSQEVYHIFDAYRRNRSTFSVRNAANRNLGRFNEKMRDGAKGLGLMANIYRDYSLGLGFGFETFWPYIAKSNFADNILASSIAFDHFARQLQRPESGIHFADAEGVWRSDNDSLYTPSNNINTFVVPDGAWGDKWGNMNYGGALLENRLCENCGEYDSSFTMNVGSYYEKLFTAYLMTESVDNFISDSRRDFLDGRYRSVSLADLFPDGYRRWLANNLTDDEAIKGVRIATSARGVPVKDENNFPESGFGWTHWNGANGPEICFPSLDSNGVPDGNGGAACVAEPPANTMVVESQVGWEQQKFLIAETMLYLMENQQQNWFGMLRLWELGADADPGMTNRIEFHYPAGKNYVAQTFGKETIFGKVVQKGIAARVLEYANDLLGKAYDVDPGPDYDHDGNPDWWIPRMSADGRVHVKFDPGIGQVTDDGQIVTGYPGCDATDNSACQCSDNVACATLQKYVEVPFFMRQTMAAYGLLDPEMRGIY